MEFLDGADAQDFSVINLAKRLGAAPMSLYTYFPSRDALLEAVADAVFSEFQNPPETGRWQDFVLSWLRALASHFEHHPAALHLIAWEDHLSAGWLRAWAPVLRVLSEQQPDAERLIFAVSWFSNASIGLIRAQLTGPERVDRHSTDALDRFPPKDRHLLSIILGHDYKPHRSEVMEFGFRNIVTGLEELFTAE